MNAAITLAAIQNASRSNDTEKAEAMLRDFLGALFALPVNRVEIRRDTLSLNSVNGFIHLAARDPKSGAHTLFFKFHHEESEEGIKEYYNSKLLEENGYPVEMPVYASHEVGKQVLLYPLKTSERMADLCKRLDAVTSVTPEMQSVLAAQGALDTLTCERYLATLHEATLAQIHDEPILQLFHRRLTDGDDGHTLGGRYARFYAGKVFELPGRHVIRYEDLASLAWRINGKAYDYTLADAFADALVRLAPAAHATKGKDTYPAVVAHGDAHNGNVWYNASNPPALSLFDPAFAGPHVPALLAEIKPLFHNIFAHPLWLYDPTEADSSLHITFEIHDGYIKVEHNWRLSLLREQFLMLKRDRLFRPLLAYLREKNLLPPDWQRYMRLALFCCPTLVMNLRAHAGGARNAHTPKTSLLGLATAMTLACAPVDGSDTVSEFFAELG